jgi:hypothetical protein
MAKKEKRECSYCHGYGHNKRTCTKRLADESVGGSPLVEPVVAAVATSTALVTVEPQASVSDMPSPGIVHQPIEFEEAVKQVHVNGTTLRLAVREFDSGIADLAFRITRAGGKPQEISVDQEVGVKLWEMFGWALQQLAARRNMKGLPHRAQPNGPVKAETHGA